LQVPGSIHQVIGIADCVTAEFADGDVIQTVRCEGFPLESL